MGEAETMDTNQNIFHSDVWHRADGGPRYSQLSAHLAQAINDGLLKQGFRFPAERELALLADVSRVTIRKALNELVDAGLIELNEVPGTSYLVQPRALNNHCPLWFPSLKTSKHAARNQAVRSLIVGYLCRRLMR